MTANDVKNVIIWGNHSSTQYPDVNHAKVNVKGKEVGVYEAIKDDSWLKGDFILVRCLFVFLMVIVCLCFLLSSSESVNYVTDLVKQLFSLTRISHLQISCCCQSFALGKF